MLQFVENINKAHTKRRIFVLTPERAGELFKYKDSFNIGLFLFDEAQISEENIRGIRFDALVDRINKNFPTAKKVFTHPFISNPDAQLIKHNFTKESIYNVLSSYNFPIISITRYLEVMKADESTSVNESLPILTHFNFL